MKSKRNANLKKEIFFSYKLKKILIFMVGEVQGSPCSKAWIRGKKWHELSEGPLGKTSKRTHRFPRTYLLT